MAASSSIRAVRGMAFEAVAVEASEGARTTAITDLVALAATATVPIKIRAEHLEVSFVMMEDPSCLLCKLVVFQLARLTGTANRDSKSLPYHLDIADIKADLSGQRPIYPLSCYGPGRDPPRQLIEGPVEISPEELRVRYYAARAAGQENVAVSKARAIIQSTLTKRSNKKRQSFMQRCNSRSKRSQMMSKVPSGTLKKAQMCIQTDWT